MVEAGMLKPAEAIDHPNASVLERAVGSKPGVEADISDKLELVEGDAILLCSDGLSGYVADPAIEKVLRSPATVQAIPEQLMGLAMQAGGEDNVTVQFIQYGQRKEALSGPRATQNLAITKPDRSRPAYITTAAVLLLFAAFGAVAHTYVARKLKAIENQMIAAKDKFENNVNNLIERLQGSTIQIMDLQYQLAAVTESSNSSTVTLTGKLGEANAAKVEAAKQVSELQNKLRMAGDAKDNAESLASQLEQQLRTAKAEKKVTRIETDNLLTQLEKAEIKISNLEAELREAKSIDAEESEQPTDQEQ
jgi:cell division protein FtsL/sulfur transfer complex TusBCD TusB component (DsrH family)